MYAKYNFNSKLIISTENTDKLQIWDVIYFYGHNIRLKFMSFSYEKYILHNNVYNIKYATIIFLSNGKDLIVVKKMFYRLYMQIKKKTPDIYKLFFFIII